ncbi:MAG: hypothetical protein QOI24_3229 [Acidobacteriota bacterium]|nr:hypothetical protein [Acidobacteriota bacterium]
MTLSLASVFAAVATKRLALVDLPKRGSHQHELNSSSRLREFFGREKISGELQWHHFTEDAEPSHASGTFTFYDSRARSAARTGRTEWRMYYTGAFLERAAPGDLLVLARTQTGDVHALVFEEHSSWLRSARVLFDVDPNATLFRVFAEDELDRHALEFVSARILEELQLGVALPSTPDHEAIAERELTAAIKAGLKFPTTARMAAVARELAGIESTDADATLLRWLEAEERIFRAAERQLVEVKLRAGFADVDDFISYSLSVQNRRKSRMGLALQNHLTELFRANELRFSAQAYTENRKKPDFLFPGESDYHDATFDASRLAMLAAKSSCKDRWSQILPEADRIPIKHLCTLEASISEAQTEEMARKEVVLVLPYALHATYSASQRATLLTLQQFIEQLRQLQR